MLILRRNASLIFSLTKRDIQSRYINSSLGLIWSLCLPLFMLAIYSFIFGFVFKSKWGNEISVNYSLVMFIGLIVHSFFSDCLGRATGLIQGNANYVKKVIFPLETLCWVSLLSSLFQFFISFAVFSAFFLISGNELHYTLIFVPLVIIPLIIMSYSLILFISALSVYVRDVSHIISVLISIILFMSPVFYSVDSVPETYRWLLFFNPLTFIIESIRDCIIYGKIISFPSYALYFSVSLVLYILSLKWFRKLKDGFSDVI